MLCDGYKQCEDGSDEDPSICNVCPKEKGWPFRRIRANKMRATFKCKHRYNTNRTICATPCDGIDDMCLNYADEDDCKIPSFLELVLHVALAAVASWPGALALALFWTKWCKKRITLEKAGQVYVEMGNENERINYTMLRDSGLCGFVVQDFIIYIKSTKNIHIQKKLCKRLYDMEVSLHQIEGEADLYIMQNFGTNDSTSRFLDLERKSISIKIESFLYKRLPPRIYQLIHSVYIKRSRVTIHSFVKVVLYYTDLYKDIYLALLFYQQMIIQPEGFIFSGDASFPTAIFFGIVASIIMTEVCNLVTLVFHPRFVEWSRTKKILTSLFWPMMPAFLMFNEFWEEMKLINFVQELHKKIGKTKDWMKWKNFSEATLSKTMNQIYKIEALLFELRANDNSFEHFVQLTVLLIIIFFSRTRSATMADFNKVFIEEGSELVFISALLSVWSLVHGPIKYLTSRKNRFMGITATLLLIPYYAICVSTRLFVTLLLFTPDLGLFDTMHHYTKGRMPMFSTLVRTIDVIYEPDNNITFIQHWESNYRLGKFNDFLSIPSNFSIYISVGTFIMHLIAAFMFLQPLFKRSGDGIVRRFMRGILTLVSAPLFCDWEAFYEESDNITPVAECWKMSKKLYFKFQGLFIFESYVALVPMLLLKAAVDNRGSILNESVFKPLPDEDLSTYMVNLLLILGFSVPILSSMLQTALAYAYFKYGHPWAKVLEFQVFSPNTKQKNENIETSQDLNFFHEVLADLLFPWAPKMDRQDDKGNETKGGENEQESEHLEEIEGGTESSSNNGNECKSGNDSQMCDHSNSDGRDVANANENMTEEAEKL